MRLDFVKNAERQVKIPESALIAGCGYVGGRVAASWRKCGMQVYGITRSELKAKELSSTGITPIVFDLAQTSIPQLPDVDVVLWSVGFERSSETSRHAIWIDGLQRLLDGLPSRTDEQRRRILYTSSTSVYGDGHGQNVDEDTIPNPTAEGGRACFVAEQLLQQYAIQKSACVSILRLGGIYGPNRLLRRIEDLQNAVPINSPPDEWLNLIHVDDAVTTIDCISRMESPPTLVNVVGNSSVTRREYYSALAKLADAPPPIFETSQSPRRGGNRRVVSLVRESLSIAFKFDSVVDGLRSALAQ